MEFKIEKNIPMPSKRKPLNPYQIVLSQMAIGDSVLVNSYSDYTKLKYYSRKRSIDVSSRREAVGLRVWRTK